MAEEALKYRPQYLNNIIDEDEMLVSAAKKDPEAMARLYDKYYKEIIGYIYHCTIDSSMTEDLTSNVFLAALGNIGRYKWRRIPFRSWLYRIATNEIRMYWRRRSN